MPLAIIAVTTTLHFFWCHLFVKVLNLGIYGGALALTTTYSLDMILLYIAALIHKESKPMMSFNIKNAFKGWAEYFAIATPATLQLIVLWWYFEC